MVEMNQNHFGQIGEYGSVSIFYDQGIELCDSTEFLVFLKMQASKNIRQGNDKIKAVLDKKMVDFIDNHEDLQPLAKSDISLLMRNIDEFTGLEEVQFTSIF